MEIFERVAGERLDTEDQLTERLLGLVSKSNYIPPGAEREYKQALLREFKKYIGEDVEEDTGGLEIKVFGPGCPRCDRLMNDVMSVLARLDVAADVEHVRDLSRIAELGPVGMPALMINGKIVSSGRVPSDKDIIRWLREVEI